MVQGTEDKDNIYMYVVAWVTKDGGDTKVMNDSSLNKLIYKANIFICGIFADLTGESHPLLNKLSIDKTKEQHYNLITAVENSGHVSSIRYSTSRFNYITNKIEEIKNSIDFIKN